MKIIIIIIALYTEEKLKFANSKLCGKAQNQEFTEILTHENY